MASKGSQTFKPGDRLRNIVQVAGWVVGTEFECFDFNFAIGPDDGSYFIEDASGAVLFEHIEDVAVPAPPASDAVFRPNHYARFVIEPLTFINANKLSYNVGNVVKYVCRYDAKNGLEDLKKGRRYLDIQIETMAREVRVAEGEDPSVVWKDVL